MDTTLERALTRWHNAELVTDDQIDRIRDFEDDRGHSDPVPSSSGDRDRSNLFVEGLAYLGAALAFGAGFAVFGQLWDELAATGRIVLSAGGTGILGGAAFSLRDRTSGSLERLATVLAALSVVGVAVTVALTLSELTGLSDEWTAVAAGLAAVAVGTPVHLARASWPTTLALGAAVLTAAFGAGAVFGLVEGSVPIGIMLIGIGLAWAAAGWSGLARPRSAFEVTGLLTGGVGIQTMAFGDQTVLALVFGLLVSAAAMAIGLSEDRTSPAVLGGLGVTVFAPQLVFELFGENIGGPLALFVGGVALVGVAVTILRQREVV